MRDALPPDSYHLANRLSAAEAQLEAVERALSKLFHRVNVNRPGEPAIVLDRLLLTLAELHSALEKARLDPPRQIQAPRRGLSISASIEDELPAVGPGGRGRQLRVQLEDEDDVQEARLFLVPDEKPE